MIPTKAYRGIAIAAICSFLIPPMLLVTIVAFYAVFSDGISNMFRYPGNWLLVGPFGFALLSSFRAPRSERARFAIALANLLILVCSLLMGLAILLGLAPGAPGPRT